VFVAGHQGMVGSALCRQIRELDGVELVTRDRAELDLTHQQSVDRFFESESIDHVYLAAAKVGGIGANSARPAEFIHQNLAIQAHVIHGAWRSGVNRLLFLGSSCIYPRLASQPIAETALLGGPLEPTNDAYAVAKIAGLKMCEAYRRQYGADFRSVMPTNLYGPGDNFDLEDSHVLPALLRRFHQAVLDGSQEVRVWGSGKPRREFLHVDDLAAACLHVMSIGEERYWRKRDAHCAHVNVGYGEDLSIAALSALIARIVGFDGRIAFDTSRPDGTPRKLLDSSAIEALGWRPRISLEDGIAETAEWMKRHWDRITAGAGEG
jgi:GDP-L-fucose synthase